MLNRFLIELLLEAEGPAAGNGDGGAKPHPPGGLGDFLLPLIVIFFIFWLLVFRPESKKRKERERKVNTVKKGDQVVTTGGIYGKVMRVEEQAILVQIDKDKDVRVTFSKTAVFDVIPAEGSSEGGSR